MYIVIDESNKIIAFHDEKRVVKRYVENYNRCNETTIYFQKIKKSTAKKILKNKEDLYLVKYRSTYIQSKYYDTMEISETEELEEFQQTKDVLYRLLELDYNNMSKKEIKHLYGVINILNERISCENEFTPDINQLKQIQENIDMYKYHMY